MKNSEKILIAKQRNRFVIMNFLAFFLIFVSLGVLAVVMVKNYFFDDIEIELNDSKRMVQETIYENNKRIGFKSDSNARLLIVFYDENQDILACSDNLYSYLIEGYYQYIGMFSVPGLIDPLILDEYMEKVSEAQEQVIFDLNQTMDTVNRFEKVETGEDDYYFMTMSFAVDNESAKSVKYCKMFIMVNGEINSSARLISIYISCIGFLILLCSIASIFLSYNAIRPLSNSLDKQLTFVGDASHELRTPLSIVQSKLENILTRKDETVYDVSEDIAVSLREISRLNKLTSDLLTLARSDNNKENLHFESVRLDEVVKETAAIFVEMASLEEKQFTVDVEEVIASVDANKIRQLMVILLDNALRYTNPNDQITVTLRLNSSEVVLTVADTGIGMNDETMKHVFERFYRADKARSRETGGNGLGLAIAMTIASQHHGKITVDHNSPKGTIFTVVIPKGKVK